MVTSGTAWTAENVGLARMTSPQGSPAGLTGSITTGLMISLRTGYGFRPMLTIGNCSRDGGVSTGTPLMKFRR